MSGADLANLVNEAALGAVREGCDEVRERHFEAARDRVLMGLQRTSMALSEHEKWAVARHEAGHAVTAYLLDHADPVHKVTILPAGMSLGVTQQLPRNERHMLDRSYLLDTLAVQLGGRVAEELLCEDICTGAANDLLSATQMARRMVREWGMSDAIGLVALGAPGSIGDEPMAPEWSERTADLVDSEVARILREQKERTRQLLTSHADVLADLAAALVEHETLDAGRGQQHHRAGPSACSHGGSRRCREGWPSRGRGAGDGLSHEGSVPSARDVPGRLPGNPGVTCAARSSVGERGCAGGALRGERAMRKDLRPCPRGRVPPETGPSG